MTARESGSAVTALVHGSEEPLAWLVREHERSRYAGRRPPTRREVRTVVREINRAFGRAPKRVTGPAASP
jgi:hypothetical protein